MAASAIARGVRKPALYNALAREPYLKKLQNENENNDDDLTNDNSQPISYSEAYMIHQLWATTVGPSLYFWKRKVRT